ncbi:MAG TPA: hypothetical protein VD737_00185 [Steroidobacteraceae bacterium]|nr:hypothetical protein [Steroidobacteraceae bacterium]
MTSSTTTGRRSPLQHWLEFLASARSDAHRSTHVEARTYVEVVQAQREDVTVGWDPHEVWLDRIKRPRDRRIAASLEPSTDPAPEATVKESR